jgi:hypothetical protein
MNITNIYCQLSRSDFQRWTFELEGNQYNYITSSTYPGIMPPGGVDFKPYTRISHVDSLDTEVAINKFMPLDPGNPKKGIEKFYAVVLLQ